MNTTAVKITFIICATFVLLLLIGTWRGCN
jgi:hypothetical protein